MVIWTDPAKKNLRDILDYIRQSSPYYTEKVREEIVKKSETLSTFPTRGRVVPEFENENVREIFVYSYRLIFEIETDRTSILAVIHGKMDLENALINNQEEDRH